MLSARDVALSWIEALNGHDATAVAALCHDDVVNLQLPVGEESIGRQTMLEHFSRLFEAFPDCNVMCNYLHVDGGVAILEWELNGTWHEPFFGHQPNKRAFKVQGCEIFHVVHGKVKSQRGYWDKFSWFHQLGIPID